MKIGVIGKHGQLASELGVIASQSDEHQFNFIAKETIDVIDLKSIEYVFSHFELDIIINCAAYTAVDKAEQEKEAAELINTNFPNLLAQYCKEKNIHLVQISTDFVFDGTSSIPLTENIQANPISVYGLSKLNGEVAIQNSGCRYTIIRTSWLYSSFGHNFVKTMMRLGTTNEKINVVFDQIGTPTYANDLAETIVRNFSKMIDNPNQYYHYSNEGVASWYDFSYEIMRIAKLSCDVFPIKSAQYPTPARRPNYSVMDKSKIKMDFGIIIPHWKESLKICIAKLKESNQI